MTSNDYPFSVRDSDFISTHWPGWSIEAIHAEAQRRIVAMLGYAPEQQAQWIAKQINMTARGTELVERKVEGIITPEEQSELDLLKGFFAKVKLIRAFSNELESGWVNGQRPDIYAGWPY